MDEENLSLSTTELTGVKESEEEVRTRLWKEFDGNDEPDVFQNITLARDGGFTEVGQLWYSSRWLSAALVIGSLVSNTYVILYEDLLALRKAISDQYHEREFLIARTIAQSILHTLAYVTGDPAWADHVPRGLEIIVIIELAGLAYLNIMFVYYIVKACIARNSPLDRWTCVVRAFFELLPELGTYSAMRLLNFVSPSVVTTDLYNKFVEDRKPARKALDLVWFVLTRTVMLIVGLDAFVMKYRENAPVFHGKTLDAHKFWRLVVFLMQMLGIVQLGLFVRYRLFAFIFAGEDSIMQLKEQVRAEVWGALLARKMREEYSFHHWLALMVTFCDEDFQKLVLNDRSRRTQRAILSPSDSAKEISQSLLWGKGDDATRLRRQTREITPEASNAGSSEDSDDSFGCFGR